MHASSSLLLRTCNLRNDQLLSTRISRGRVSVGDPTARECQQVTNGSGANPRLLIANPAEMHASTRCGLRLCAYALDAGAVAVTAAVITVIVVELDHPLGTLGGGLAIACAHKRS
jgi:hypothetical protein